MTQDTSVEYTWTDALLLFSIAYCDRHGYVADLAHILRTTDGFNRSYPMRHELEDGLNRLLAGQFISEDSRVFAITGKGKNLVELALASGQQDTPALHKLRELECLLAQDEQLATVSQRVRVTDEDVAGAIKATYAL